jgi:hypothetical protein
MKKYNRELKRYEDYSIPEEWNCPLYTPYMDEIINCCQCGEELQAGNSYTSLEVHNLMGLGYGVCLKCYLEEKNRRESYEE